MITNSRSLDQSSRSTVVGLQLDSVSILRKFIGFFDLLLSMALSEVVFVNCNQSLVFETMYLHHSQFVWYRLLFIVFSRYSYINTFSKISYQSSRKATPV